MWVSKWGFPINQELIGIWKLLGINGTGTGTGIGILRMGMNAFSLRKPLPATGLKQVGGGLKQWVGF